LFETFESFELFETFESFELFETFESFESFETFEVSAWWPFAGIAVSAHAERRLRRFGGPSQRYGFCLMRAHGYSPPVR
jgi:hypothetical protein